MGFLVFLRLAIGVKAIYSFLTKVGVNLTVVYKFIQKEMETPIFLGCVLVRLLQMFILVVLGWWGLTPLLNLM